MSELRSLIKSNLTDKDTVHSYLEAYEEYFEPLRDKPINILEIGIYYGGSIKLWSEYFKQANIYAVDKDDCAKWLSEYGNVTKYVNDAYSQEFLDKIKDIKFDIIIDDGSHKHEDVLYVLKNMSHLLSDNGLLIIEDVQKESLISEMVESLPNNLRTKVEVVDLREVKNRYDDMMFVLDKSLE